MELANSGSDLRDRGAFVDALRAGAVLVTSDRQLVVLGPAARIEAVTGVRPITPDRAVDRFIRPSAADERVILPQTN